MSGTKSNWKNNTTKIEDWYSIHVYTHKVPFWKVYSCHYFHQTAPHALPKGLVGSRLHSLTTKVQQERNLSMIRKLNFKKNSIVIGKTKNWHLPKLFHLLFWKYHPIPYHSVFFFLQQQFWFSLKPCLSFNFSLACIVIESLL